MNLSKENGYSFLLSQKGFLNDPYRRPFIGKKGRGSHIWYSMQKKQDSLNNATLSNLTSNRAPLAPSQC